jgi:hypothetical protein
MIEATLTVPPFVLLAFIGILLGFQTDWLIGLIVYLAGYLLLLSIDKYLGIIIQTIRARSPHNN